MLTSRVVECGSEPSQGTLQMLPDLSHLLHDFISIPPRLFLTFMIILKSNLN